MPPKKIIKALSESAEGLRKQISSHNLSHYSISSLKYVNTINYIVSSHSLLAPKN